MHAPPEGCRHADIEADGQAVVGGSGELGVGATDECSGIEGTCYVPAAPLVGPDGTTFVIGAYGNSTTVAAVSPSGTMMAGWPYRSKLGHQAVGTCLSDVCDGYGLAASALGPGNVVYLLHRANDPSAGGGSIVAVGPDSRLRVGWPVVLTRPGSEFWSVVVGPDGTAYALAIEPETSKTSSASILAIAPDSTVRYTTTIIDP